MNNDGQPARTTPRWIREQAGETAAPSSEERAILAEVLRGIRRVRHGTIQLQVQDARVVQIDITEKRRL